MCVCVCVHTFGAQSLVNGGNFSKKESATQNSVNALTQLVPALKYAQYKKSLEMEVGTLYSRGM